MAHEAQRGGFHRRRRWRAAGPGGKCGRGRLQGEGREESACTCARCGLAARRRGPPIPTPHPPTPRCHRPLGGGPGSGPRTHISSIAATCCAMCLGRPSVSNIVRATVYAVWWRARGGGAGRAACAPAAAITHAVCPLLHACLQEGAGGGALVRGAHSPRPARVTTGAPEHPPFHPLCRSGRRTHPVGAERAGAARHAAEGLLARQPPAVIPMEGMEGCVRRAWVGASMGQARSWWHNHR